MEKGGIVQVCSCSHCQFSSLAKLRRFGYGCHWHDVRDVGKDHDEVDRGQEQRLNDDGDQPRWEKAEVMQIDCLIVVLVPVLLSVG